MIPNRTITFAMKGGKKIKNQILVTYLLWLPCIYSVICFHTEIIISSDYGHSRFHCVFCNFLFLFLLWNFFLAFFFCVFFPPHLFVGERKWTKRNGCFLEHLHYYLWAGSMGTDLCGTNETFLNSLVKHFAPHRNFLGFCHLLQSYSFGIIFTFC